MTTHPQATVSIQRALTRTLLLFLGAYLALAGGTFTSLVLYQTQVINIGLIIIGGFAWVLWRWRAKRPFPITALDWSLLAWVAAGLIASIFSIDPRVSLEHWVYQLVCVLIFFLMADLQQTGKSVETWIWITLIASVWFLYSGFNELFSWYARWFAIGGWADPIPPTTIRITGTLTHPNALALYLNMLWPLALARLLKIHAWGVRIVLGIYISACFILLFFTSSRGGWLGAAAALSMFILLAAIDHRALVQRAWAGLRRRRWLLTAIVAAILLLAAVGGFLLYRQTQHPTHAQGDPRWYIWKVAVGMFLEDPLTGGGPGMYAFEFLRTYSVPPEVYLGHSHNAYFDALGDTGLLGSVSFLVVLIFSIKLIKQRWQVFPTGHRATLTGSIAVFAGVALHSVFESPQWTPLVGILLAALLAQIAAQKPASPARHPLRAATWLPAAGWLVISCLSFYSIRAYQRYASADVYAQQGDYKTAAEVIESAASMDPALNFYRIEAGRAWAAAAVDQSGAVQDVQSLDKAIRSYQLALQAHDEFSLDWYDLGSLFNLAKNDRSAVKAISQAVDKAPGSADLWVAYGLTLEQSNLIDDALSAYKKALALDPSLIKDEFFSLSELRKQAVQSIPPNPTDLAWNLLSTGNYEKAETIFRARLSSNKASDYLGLSMALQGMNRLEEANAAEQIALFLDSEVTSDQELRTSDMSVTRIFEKIDTPWFIQQALYWRLSILSDFR